MALVPIMPVDLFELSNNHVWRDEFAFHDFGEAAGRLHERRARRERASPSGAGSISGLRTTMRCSTADSGCGRRPAPPRASIPVPLGFGRVYVHLDGPASTAGLAQRAGRRPELRHDRPDALRRPSTATTRAPFRSGAGARVSLAGPAECACPLKSIEVVVNGEVARTLVPANRKTDRGPTRARSRSRCRSTARPGSRSAASRTGRMAASGSRTPGRSTSTSPTTAPAQESRGRLPDPSRRDADRPERRRVARPGTAGVSRGTADLSRPRADGEVTWPGDR